MSSEPVSRSSVAPTGSSASVTGRSSGGAAPWGPAGQARSGAAGSQEYGQPGTTGTGGSSAASARTIVDFAVPFSPRTRTPPTAGDTALSSSARRRSARPTTAENGYGCTVCGPFRGCPRPQFGVVWAAGVSWLPDQRNLPIPARRRLAPRNDPEGAPPSAFQPVTRPWPYYEGSLPGDSGGTAPDSHRVPPLPPGAMLPHRAGRVNQPRPSRWAAPSRSA